MDGLGPRHLFLGKLSRDFILPATGRPLLDAPGGNALYAATGFRIWESSTGLVARVGEDYPRAWLDEFAKRGFDIRGVRTLSQSLDLRTFYAYWDGVRYTENPVTHFARLGLAFPRKLLNYAANTRGLDSRTHLTPYSLRQADLPPEYLHAAAAHFAPLDYLSHSLMPAVLRQAGATTLTLDPSPGYMNPAFWEHIPPILTGLTAFLPSEEEARNLFHGRLADFWEMAEALATYGCEFIVIKRGEKGQLLYDAVGKKRWEIPAYPAQIVDPTGAGDAFAGGFLAGYRRTYDPVQAVLHGNVSASLVVEGRGVFYPLDVLPGLPEARLEVLQGNVRKV